MCVYNNELSGTFPLELGSLGSLIRLYVYNNQLSGTMPLYAVYAISGVTVDGTPREYRGVTEAAEGTTADEAVARRAAEHRERGAKSAAFARCLRPNFTCARIFATRSMPAALARELFDIICAAADAKQAREGRPRRVLREANVARRRARGIWRSSRGAPRRGSLGCSLGMRWPP